MFLLLAILLQLPPQLPDPDAAVTVGGEVEGPYIFREDVGQTTKVVLKNGLTVIVRESNAIPLVSATTLIKAGYADEPVELPGIARIVERMVASPTAARGAAMTSTTDVERTVYGVVVPADSAVAAIEAMSGAVWQAGFDVVRLAHALDVVWLESSRSDPPARALDYLYRTAFTGHRLARPRIGSRESLLAITQPDAGSFYDRHYQPPNAILVVVGQFQRERMLDELVRIHEGIGEVASTGDRVDPGDLAVDGDATADIAVLPVEPAQTGFRYDWALGPIEQSRIAMGYHVPGRTGPESEVHALEVLSTILTGGRASRMNLFLREEQGSITHASSSYDTFGDAGYFALQLEAEDPDPAEIGALGELDRIRRFGVTQEELDRAKVWIGQDYYRRLETVEGVARQIALHEEAGDWKTHRFVLDGIQAVTRDDVQRVVRTYFGPDNLSVFEYLPESGGRVRTSGDFEANVLDQVPANIVQRSIEERDVTATVAAPGDELVMDVIHPLVRRSILRGPEVFVAEDHRLPLISFGLFYPGGRLYETADNTGITELMLRSALRGTLRFNTADISRQLENAGARIEVVNEPDFFGYVLDGVTGQMAAALGVLVEVLQEPTFPEAEVEQEKAALQARLRRLREDGVRHAEGLFMSAVFDGDPYGRPGIGSDESVAALGAEDLAQWHEDHQRTLVPLIVIAGDTGGTGLVASIAESLTNEDLFPRDISSLPLPAAPLDREEVTASSPSTPLDSTVLIYGAMVAPFAHADRLPLKVVGELLSSRLEDLFPPRALEVSSQFMGRAGVLRIRSSLSPGDEAAVVRTMQSEIGRLIEDPVGVEELAAAIDSAIADYEGARQTRRGRVLGLAATLIAGGEASSVEVYGEQLRELDAESVRAVVERYLNASQAKILSLLPRPD